MSSCFKYLLVYSSPQIDCTRANESKFAITAYTFVSRNISKVFSTVGLFLHLCNARTMHSLAFVNFLSLKNE